MLRQCVLGAVLGLLSLASNAEGARVIVKLKADASLLRSSVVQTQAASGSSAGTVMQRLGVRRGLRVADGREMGNRLHLALAQGMSSEALASVLAKDSDVLYAVPDRWRKPHSVVPNDPFYAASANGHVDTGQWYLRPYDSTIVAATNVQGAWATATGAGQVVAVVDSGVRFDHPDLQSQFLSGYNMISYASVSGTGGGRSSDASDLGDWVTSGDVTAITSEVGVSPDCDPADHPVSSWHGTKVSGIVGAQTNNARGMAGVAPDAQILPVRSLGKCGGWDSDIIDGMRWAGGLAIGVPGSSGWIPATSPRARVVNMSLGAPDSCSQAYKDVVAELISHNVVVVASAGNDDGKAVSSPANCPGVIAVTGLRHTGTKVGYSSVGPEVTVAAPSGNCANSSSDSTCHYAILTTTNTGLTTPVAGSAGEGYTGSSTNISYGTSFAAPQVSGTVALMLEARSSLTPAAVAALLRKTARTFPTTASSTCHLPDGSDQLECNCTSLTCGAGMLDAAAAVQAAANNAVAVIAFTPTSTTAGDTIQFSGSQSMASPGGASITSYLWTLVDGGGIATTTGWNSTASSVSVTPSGAGAFQVRLTVQDNLGQTASVDQWVVVAAPTTTTSHGGGGGGGGGGGSVDAWALVALCLCLALALPQARRGARLKA